MDEITKTVKKNIKYLKILAKQYPNIKNVYTEIINLRAILNLPKGTEHFMSDIHGEYEAFSHIINNCSGVIREKVQDIFGENMSETEISELCTLIYYPEQKLRLVKQSDIDIDSWYETTLSQLTKLCQVISSKYTRSKVRKSMPEEFAYIIDELLHADYVVANQAEYYKKITESILAISVADQFIIAMSTLIKKLAVDKLHIVGDIFDRGPRPDLIMDELMNHHSVDIQWGNHDILWMGAAAGSRVCISAVIYNSVSYGNLRVLEEGYGINLRPLALFAEKTYSDCSCFKTKTVNEDDDNFDPRDNALSSKICKAIGIIMFKLEGQLWRRHPEYHMDDRMLLHKIDYQHGKIDLDGHIYNIKDFDFPTICTVDPYALSEDEARVMTKLEESFTNCERLAKHVDFLYKKGDMYKNYNQNLMFHGCIPMDENGEFTSVELWNNKKVSSRELLDLAQEMAHTAYYGKGKLKQSALDGMWYLWCGKHSPLFGRSRMTTLERVFINEPKTWKEEKNPYYIHVLNKDMCQKVLMEFGLCSEISHIINGHIPVRAVDGESPVKADGKLITIDGGFSRAYQPTTGIAGYTLIYNSHGLRLSAHKPFLGTTKAVEENIDIHSVSQVFETLTHRLRVMDTDVGEDISEQIYDLSLLVSAYKSGLL